MSWEKINKLKRFVALCEQHQPKKPVRVKASPKARYPTYQGVERFLKIPACYSRKELEKDLCRINDPFNLHQELNW